MEKFIIIVIFIILILVIVTQCFANSMTVYETIIYEGAGESLQGQIAIACVIRNRARERNKTFEEVCLEPQQFSCWNRALHREYAKYELERAIEAWYLSQECSQFKANLYCRYDVYPYWRNSPKTQFIKRIGNHVFYYEKGCDL